MQAWLVWYQRWPPFDCKSIDITSRERERKREKGVFPWGCSVKHARAKCFANTDRPAPELLSRIVQASSSFTLYIPFISRTPSLSLSPFMKWGAKKRIRIDFANSLFHSNCALAVLQTARQIEYNLILHARSISFFSNVIKVFDFLKKGETMSFFLFLILYLIFRLNLS